MHNAQCTVHSALPKLLQWWWWRRTTSQSCTTSLKLHFMVLILPLKIMAAHFCQSSNPFEITRMRKGGEIQNLTEWSRCISPSFPNLSTAGASWSGKVLLLLFLTSHPGHPLVPCHCTAKPSLIQTKLYHPSPPIMVLYSILPPPEAIWEIKVTKPPPGSFLPTIECRRRQGQKQHLPTIKCRTRIN